MRPGGFAHTNETWWLRTPVGEGSAAYVDVDGLVHSTDGKQVDETLVVRPALQLDLSKVTFDSKSKTFSVATSTVAVTDVTLEPIKTSLTVDGDAVALTATVSPNNASDKKVKWSVGGTNPGGVKLYSDEACTTEVGADATSTLTVYAKGISAGSATVTVTTNDGDKTASCDVTVNDSQTQTEGLITTITATGKEQASYSPENVATVSFSNLPSTSTETYDSSYIASWGWYGYGWTATVTPANGYTITKCVFYDNNGATATDSTAPFVVETTKDDKTPQVNGAQFSNSSKGIAKIEVYGYATPVSSYSVTVTPGSNMTKTAASGAESQADLSSAMTDVVYTADDGYYFPENYSVEAVNGISVTRDSYTQITVSVTPTADAAITLTAPMAKTKPDAPTTAAAVDCTTADNNDGKLTGVTTAMEYKKSDADSWTAGTGDDITGLVPGTYYVRVKATDTTLASDNQELTVNAAQTQTETLLTTVTPTGKSTYSQTPEGVVTVTVNNNFGYHNTYGWLWDSGSVSVAANDGYTITKCVFIQNAKDPITISAAQFAIHFEQGRVTEDYRSMMDGVTSIEVYGYASKATQTITAADVTATYGDTGKSVSGTTSGDGAISYSVKSGDAVTVDGTTGALTILKAGTAVVTVTAAATDDYAAATKNVTVTINTKAMTVSADDVTATVDGQPHGITVTVTDPASGATVKYGTEEGSYSLDASPTQTEVGEKTVYYQVTADNYTTYTASAKVTVSAKGTQTITASDVTVTYGETGKKVKATTDGDGAISYAVKEGSADYIDVDATTGALTINKVGTATVIVTAAETSTYAQATKEVTVTINKANAVAATVTANNRTYDGTDKPLVNVDDSTLVGGEMWYAVTTENTAPTDESLYTTSMPSKTDAGTYYVWYKVVGDENHVDTEPEVLKVTIDVAKGETKIEIEVQTDDKSPKLEASNLTKDVAESTLTDKEKEIIDEAVNSGKDVDVDVYLAIRDIADEITAEDKAKLEAKASDADQLAYFDISLFKEIIVDGSSQGATSIHELTTPLKLTIGVPKSFPAVADGYTRTYEVLRLHNGVVTVLPTSVNTDGTISFETDRLSTYAVAYTDSAIEEEVETVDMYRIYNPNSGEHFYTASVAEKDKLVKLGWRYEGIGWKAPVKSNTPVYRLYNPNAGDHHYTRSIDERDRLVSLGWIYEGIGWYSDDAESVPLYRQYNPNAKAGNHNYTASKNENDWLISLGWRGEGVGWYGVK